MKRLTLIFSLMIALVGLNANAAMYIVGTNPFGDWDPAQGVQMEEKTPGVYTLDATLVQNDIWFIFTTAIGDWNAVNGGRYDSGMSTDLTIHADEEFTPVQGNTNKSFAFSGTAGETYTFTFNMNTGKAMVSGYVAPFNPLTGSLYALGQVNGNNWDPSAGIEMNTTDENIFTLTDAEVTASDDGYGYFSFTSKLGENSDDWSFTSYRRGAQADGTLVEDSVAAVLADWGSTGAFKVLPGIYDFEVNLSGNSVTLTRKGGEEPPVVDDYYIVAGTPNLFGSEWSATDTLNLMTEGEDGIFTWTKEGFETTAGTEVMFKVVANGSWNTCWPLSDENGDNNWWYQFTEDGTYDIVITFNEETKEINMVANKQGGEEPPVVTVYTVVGPEAIFGSNWNEADVNNDMTEGENGIYTWSKENVELAAGSFGFKVVGNHSWDNEWPIGYGNNWIAYVEEAGIYTIDITYAPEEADSLKITCTLTKTGDIEPVHYDGDVYIMGEVNDNGGWFTNVGVLMTRDAENNIYTALITTAGENVPEGEEIGYSYFSFTKQLAEGEADWDAIAPYRFGAVSDGDYWVTDEVLGTEIALQNGGQSFRVPAGEWNLTLSVDNMTLIIEKADTVDHRGDFNQDGLVNTSDVSSLIGMLLNGITPPMEADCNGDGMINTSDLATLITYLLNSQWPN